MMSLNKATALTLRVGIVIGMAMMIIGLAISMTGGGDEALYAGVLVLIASPLMGAFVSFVVLLRERDGFWSLIAGILIVITVIGAILSI